MHSRELVYDSCSRQTTICLQESDTNHTPHTIVPLNLILELMATKKQVGGYILDKKIGKGSFAEVWKGKIESTGEAVAVKVISRQTVQETAQLKQEVAVLKKLSSPHIVRFKVCQHLVGWSSI